MASDQRPRHECKARQEITERIGALQRANLMLSDAMRCCIPEDVRNEARIRKRDAADALVQVCLPIMREVAAGWLASTLGQTIAATSTFDEDDQLTRLARSVYLEVQESLETLTVDPDRDICALLRTITYAALHEQNNVINHQPKKKPRQPRQVIPLVEEHAGEGFEEQSIKTLAQQETLQAIKTLLTDPRIPEIDRRILSLRYTYELPYAEIAAVFGPGHTSAKVRKRCQRLTKRLHAALCPYGSGCTANVSCGYCLG